MQWPSTVVAALETDGNGQPVAFDADGTLWRGDVGEELLRHLAHHRLLPNWRGGGAYDEYERRCAIHPPDAYAFAVAVMAGFKSAELQARCDAFFAARFAGRIFGFVRPLLAALRTRGYEPWVVSASPRWIVESGAKLLGLDPAKVIGVDTALSADGTLTDALVEPLPAGEGKVAQLKARGLQPALAFGNGELDLPMLAHAKAAVVVAPFDEPGNALVAAAAERAWPVLRA